MEFNISIKVFNCGSCPFCVEETFCNYQKWKNKETLDVYNAVRSYNIHKECPQLKEMLIFYTNKYTDLGIEIDKIKFKMGIL